MNYDGTLLLVSHDRAFLDNVVTSTIAFEGEGNVQEYVGGYEDWIRQGGKFPDESTAEVEKPQKAEKKAEKKAEASKKAPEPVKAKSKLSYKLQREFDAMPDLLADLEQQLEELNEVTSAADFYTGDQEKVQATLAKLSETEQALEEAMERWVELEEMQNG